MTDSDTRDMFAAVVMFLEIYTAHFHEGSAEALFEAAHKNKVDFKEKIAMNSYEVADFMMRERRKEKP